MQEPWQTAVTIYDPAHPNYSSAQERDLIKANLQSWEILKAAIKLKLRTLSPEDPLYSVNSNRLATCDNQINYWKSELNKYNITD